MGNSSEIEKVFAGRIASWQRKLYYHSGSFYTVLPREILRANLIKKNSKCAIIFSHVIDEKTGKVLNVFDIISQKL